MGHVLAHRSVRRSTCSRHDVGGGGSQWCRDGGSCGRVATHTTLPRCRRLAACGHRRGDITPTRGVGGTPTPTRMSPLRRSVPPANAPACGGEALEGRAVGPPARCHPDRSPGSRRRLPPLPRWRFEPPPSGADARWVKHASVEGTRDRGRRHRIEQVADRGPTTKLAHSRPGRTTHFRAVATRPPRRCSRRATDAPSSCRTARRREAGR